MKQSQLQELIRHITRSVLKEFQNIDPTSNSSIHASSSSTSPDKMDAKAGNDANAPENSADAKKSKLQAIRTADMNLKGTKTQSDYFAQQLKNNKLKVTAKQKELQNLKAGKDISSGGAGSISAT